MSEANNINNIFQVPGSELPKPLSLDEMNKRIQELRGLVKDCEQAIVNEFTTILTLVIDKYDKILTEYNNTIKRLEKNEGNYKKEEITEAMKQAWWRLETETEKLKKYIQYHIDG